MTDPGQDSEPLFIPEKYDDLDETKILEKEAYRLRIVGAKRGTGKESGVPWLMINAVAVDEPDAEIVTQFFRWPSGEDDASQRLRKLRTIKRLHAHFGVPYDPSVGIKTEDFIDKEAVTTLRIGKSMDGEPENQMVLPKFQ